MGYKIVAVNPLKPFPLHSFRLANVASLDDAKAQIFRLCKEMAQLKIDRTRELNAIACASIFDDYRKFADEEVVKLEERWPKIGPALEAHLARQKRRFAHFEVSCRLLGCDNPHRQKHGRGLERNTKAHRPMVKPLFCGVHVGLRKLLTEKMLAELHVASEKRVAIAK